MSETVQTVLQRISRKLGLDPAIVSLSDNDDSQWLMDRLNQRYLELKRLLPLSPVFSLSAGSLSLLSGQRLYSLANDVVLPDLFLWSIVDDSTGNATPLPVWPVSWLAEHDPDYKYTQGVPQAVYLESSQLGVYPVPNQARQLKYQYRALPASLSSLSSTFTIPDTWLAYLELAVELDYQLWKGQGFPDATLSRLNQQYAVIYSELNRLQPTQFRTIKES